MMPSTSKGTSGWTIETLYVHFTALMEEHEKAVKAALAAAETAVNKAEYNSEKWRDSANEWRQAMDDREVKFLPRTEYTAAHQALIDRIGMLENRVTKNEGTGQGLKQGWGYLIAAVALVMTLMGIFAALKR
jgi:hypothetical protein